MTDLENDAVLLAKLANAISAAVTGGLLGAWDVISALLAMKNIDPSLFKSEIAGLENDTERQAVEQAFMGTLSLPAALQAKISSSVNVLESGVEYVEQGLALYNRVQALIA